MLYANLVQKIKTYAESVNPSGSFFYGSGDAFKSYAVNGAMPVIYLADILDTPDFGTGMTSVTLDLAFFDRDSDLNATAEQNTVVNNMLQVSNDLLMLLAEDDDLGKLNTGQRSPFYRLTESRLSGVQVSCRPTVSLSLCS